MRTGLTIKEFSMKYDLDAGTIISKRHELLDSQENIDILYGARQVVHEYEQGRSWYLFKYISRTGRSIWKSKRWPGAVVAGPARTTDTEWLYVDNGDNA
jgi:hypothetical protein